MIITNLTIHNSTYATINQTSCNSYISPSENYTWTSTGTYKDTITNAVGCDSIITIHLTINEATYSTINESACNTYTSPSKKYTWTTSGTYKDTIPNSVGCDSIITINLSIFILFFLSINETACDSFLSLSGNYIWTSS